MKKIILIVSIAMLVFAFSGCSDSKSSNEIQDFTTTTKVTSDGTTKIKLIPSVLISSDASLYEENDDNTLQSYSQVYCGQVLYLYPTVDGSESTEVEAYKKQLKSDKKAENLNTYAKVFYNENDYWININYVQPNSVPKVVITDGYNYNSDHMTDNTKTKIEKGTIIAVINDYKKSEDSDLDCVNASWRKSAKANYVDIYLKTEIISPKDDDVIAQRYLNRIEKISNQTVLSEIFENCKKLDLSEEYSQKITKAVNDRLAKLNK